MKKERFIFQNIFGKGKEANFKNANDYGIDMSGYGDDDEEDEEDFLNDDSEVGASYEADNAKDTNKLTNTLDGLIKYGSAGLVLGQGYKDLFSGGANPPESPYVNTNPYDTQDSSDNTVLYIAGGIGILAIIYLATKPKNTKI